MAAPAAASSGPGVTHPYGSPAVPNPGVPVPNGAAASSPSLQSPAAQASPALSHSSVQGPRPPAQPPSYPMTSMQSSIQPSSAHQSPHQVHAHLPQRLHAGHGQQPQPHLQRVQPTPTPPPATSSNGSPTQFSHDYNTLAECLKRTSPDVVRQVVRDNWEVALLGSQYHVAFLLNATIHKASRDTLSRAVQEFGDRMIRDNKQQVIRHLTAKDLDEIADPLLQKVTNNFLDKALARRLETISARQLVNALARAERLGYTVYDIVEEQERGVEHVIPTIVPGGPIASQSIPSSLPPHMVQQRTGGQSPVPTTPTFITQPNMATPRKGGKRPEPSQGPDGTIFCPTCGWPCASPQAFEYHERKDACGRVMAADRPEKELCPFCGCRFTSSGGLVYHCKSAVCGEHTEEKKQLMFAMIREYRHRPSLPPLHPPPQSQPQSSQNTPSPGPGPGPGPGSSVGSGSDWVTANNDPYSRLTPQQREHFEKEMKDAEDYYGGLMREAMKLAEPEQSRQLAALKNRYNTKQSVTRKKYGIRLRERRSKNQIVAERVRLFGSADGPSLTGKGGYSVKKARTSEEGHAVIPVPLPAYMPSSQDELPRKRVPVSEMGGLSGSSATAETTDPTAFLSPSQPRVLPKPSTSPSEPAVVPKGTQDDPMSIDESDSGSSSSDIPATVP